VNRISLRNKYRVYSIEYLVKEIKDRGWRRYHLKATGKLVNRVTNTQYKILNYYTLNAVRYTLEKVLSYNFSLLLFSLLNTIHYSLTTN